jgi:Zn-dependent peptidase ImmA (M78 family)
MTQPLTGIRAERKMSYRSIEECAKQLRARLGLGQLDRFDATGFFNNVLPDSTVVCSAGVITLREAIENCSQEGMTRWNPELGVVEVVLSASTYSLLQLEHVRARSTVAHELGHAYLHTDQIIRLAGMSLSSHVALHRQRNAHQACEDTEWQANAFGSAVLMPADGIERLFMRFGRHNEQAIAETYWVSMESAHYRTMTYEKALRQ